MTTFALTVVSATEPPRVETIVSVDVPSVEGRRTILAGHAPLVCALGAGDVRLVLADGTSRTITLKDGVLTVAPDKTTLLITDSQHHISGGVLVCTSK